MNQGLRRISYFVLCALPFLDLAVCAARPLRSPGVYQVIGVVLFAAVVIASWSVGARVIGVKDAGARKLALAGALLILPWAIISLLWVGIGAPFQATLQENYMRYLVLISSSILVTSAFVVLKNGHEPSATMRDEIIATLRRELGPVAVVGELNFVNALPKTRSGKIMRRVLKAVTLDVDPGDISTIEDEGSVEDARDAWHDMKAGLST